MPEPGAQARFTISLIAAMASNRVIGKDGRMPWRIPSDTERFRKITTGHTIIMGRKTYQAIGGPLPRRRNIVLTRQRGYAAPGCIVSDRLECALRQHLPGEEEVFIIGGGELYRQALPLADRIYLTTIQRSIPGDTYFPEIPADEFRVVHSEFVDGAEPYIFSILERIGKHPPASQNEQRLGTQSCS